MAITRKAIKAILPDIEDDAMKSLLALIHDEVDTLKDSNEELQTKLTAAEKERDSAKTAKEKAENDLTTYKDAQSAKETKSAKENAYRKLLEDSGVGEKHRNLIIRGTDIDSLEIGKDGKLKDAEKLTESIKTDYADYITHAEKKGADVKDPPGGNGTKYTSKTDIMKIRDAAQRQQAIMENPSLFGK